MSAQGRMSISLVIPAFNEEKYLGRTLDSAMRARENYQNPFLIEIIVVNNGSTDGTEAIALSYGAKVVLEEKRCISSVKNKGAYSASGSLVGFLDADSLVTSHMFNSIEETMSSGLYVGGGTRIELERMSLGLYFTRCITVLPAKWLLGIMGGLLFTEKKIFEDIGGFDESLYCAEDTKFALELKKYGTKAGKKFRILKDDYVITSTRSFDRFGDWYYFRNIPKIIRKGGIKGFRDKDFCRRFWYDPER